VVLELQPVVGATRRKCRALRPAGSALSLENEVKVERLGEGSEIAIPSDQLDASIQADLGDEGVAETRSPSACEHGGSQFPGPSPESGLGFEERQLEEGGHQTRGYLGVAEELRQNGRRYHDQPLRERPIKKLDVLAVVPFEVGDPGAGIRRDHRLPWTRLAAVVTQARERMRTMDRAACGPEGLESLPGGDQTQALPDRCCEAVAAGRSRPFQ